MCGGSQKSRQTSTYTPTAQATGLYNNIIGQATTAAATPYNPATQQQVANFTPDQLAAFGSVADTQGMWSPYTDRAGQLFEQAAGPISQEAISGYMNPYQQMVIDAALAQQQRSDAIAQNNLKGNAIAGGALGGNAAGVAAAQLAGEQGRNTNSMIANLLSGGYSQALSAAQSDAARQAGIGAQFGQLGQTVQGLNLADIQARLGVGNQQQAQQQNVLDTSTANAQAETMWPYQNAQWLASIGAGIGPLTGGTTTGTAKTSQGKGIGNVIGAGLSVASALSDRRAKEDEKVIGKTFDGQNVYSFRYKGSPKTQIGLMADEVERKHPEAVSTGPYGMKMVNYDRATEGFANGGAASPFGKSGSSFFPWAQIAPAQPVMPQLAPTSSGTGESERFDPAESIKLGKSARTGIQDLLKQFDGAGGWGASIEPTAGGGSGTLGNIASLFGKGFRDGGSAETNRSYTSGSFVNDAMPDMRGEHMPVDLDRARELMKMFVNDPTWQGDNAHSAASVMMPGGFANGGGIFSPYNLTKRPQFEDEFIGEVGSSGIDETAARNERMMRSFEEAERAAEAAVKRRQASPDTMAGFLSPDAPTPYAGSVPETAARNERMMRSFEEAERAAEAAVKRRQAGPDTMTGFLSPDAPTPYAGSVPETASGSGWSFEGGTIRRNGKSFADWLAGREGGAAAPSAAPFQTEIETTPAPYSDIFPGMSGAMGDPAAAAGPGGEASPGASFTDQSAPPTAPTEAPAEDFDALAFIRQQEGFRPNAYPDGRQTSIGYGTRGRPGETIDRDEAERRLRTEVSKIDRWINDNVSVNITPQQRAALLSFGFNLGTDDLDKLKNDINAGDFGRVAARMKTFNKIEKDGKLVPSEGLTDRRIREAALISGGKALPSADSLPEEVAPLVSRGSSAEAPELGSYTGKQDKQAGGLLKRMFGIDFNPLKLNEDERQALLIAGLSMMSTGDIGAGGLQGMKYLQQRETADREAAVAAAKLGLDFFKTTSDVDLGRERLALDREGKPTDDARNYKLAKDEGFTGTFMDFMREKKLLDKGGAEIPAEVAARIGLGRVFMKDAPSIKQEISQFTTADRADLAMNRGRAADVWRRIESGREALVRQLTGAGMSQTEAENQTKRYQIQPTDRNETMARKVEMLERDLRAVEEGALSGKSGAMAREWQSGTSSIAPPSSTIGSRPRARNPQTGQVVEFDGNAWVEAR